MVIPSQKIRKSQIKIVCMMRSLVNLRISIVYVEPYHNTTPKFQLNARRFNHLSLSGKHTCNEGAQARLKALRMAKRIMMGVGSKKVEERLIPMRTIIRQEKAL